MGRDHVCRCAEWLFLFVRTLMRVDHDQLLPVVKVKKVPRGMRELISTHLYPWLKARRGGEGEFLLPLLHVWREAFHMCCPDVCCSSQGEHFLVAFSLLLVLCSAVFIAWQFARIVAHTHIVGDSPPAWILIRFGFFQGWVVQHSSGRSCISSIDVQRLLASEWHTAHDERQNS